MGAESGSSAGRTPWHLTPLGASPCPPPTQNGLAARSLAPARSLAQGWVGWSGRGRGAPRPLASSRGRGVPEPTDVFASPWPQSKGGHIGVPASPPGTVCGRRSLAGSAWLLRGQRVQAEESAAPKRRRYEASSPHSCPCCCCQTRCSLPASGPRIPAVGTEIPASLLSSRNFLNLPERPKSAAP